MDRIKTALSSKFQITIPAEVRENIGLDSPNYEIVWIKIPSGAFTILPIKKVEKGENPFDRMFGMFAEYSDGHVVDEFIKEKRSEALKENI